MIVNFIPESIKNEHQLLNPHSVPLDKVAVIILGGGQGSRLGPLTKSRCKPAISFGGRYSLIDVPISHSLTSGLNQIYVIGQYLAYTLQKHLFTTYLYHGIAQNQIQLLVPEERDGEKIWYEGTADAVRKNLTYFSELSAEYFLILSGDQLYNINFHKMIDFAAETDAGMVIASQPVNANDATRMGLLRIEYGGSKLIDFHEKPQEQEILDRFHTDNFTLHGLGCDGAEGKNYLGSMGIYLFKRQTLFDLLMEDNREDFGKHLITTQMKKGDVHAFLYDGYWEDIGTIESYYKANLALAKKHTDKKLGLDCYDESCMIITKRYNLPGATFSNCAIEQSLICEGSILEAAKVINSVLGVRSIIGENTVIKDTVMMGNEYYERPNLPTGETAPIPGIGKNCVIQRAIIDENVTMGDYVKLTNEKGYQTYDDPEGRVFVREGIIVVPRGTCLPDHFRF